MVVAVPRRRRREVPPLGSVRLPPAIGFVAALVVAGVLAGTSGVVAAATGLVISLGLHRRAPEAGPWWVGVPLLVAAAAYVFRPWGAGAGWAGELAWPHLLVALSWSLVVGWVLLDDRRRAAYSRSAGRSTSQ